MIYPGLFQTFLRARHIVVSDYDLPRIFCNRRGLLSLKGSKEVVLIEGIFFFFLSLFFECLSNKFLDQSTGERSNIEERTIKNLIENLERSKRSIFRTVRMGSYAGMEPSPFSSDHWAWRETLSEPYCDHDDPRELLSLRWTEVSTANAMQFWKIAPAGFGIFFDIRSGEQWVIIATPDKLNEDEEVDRFTRWDRYIKDFDTMKPTFCIETGMEAIRLEPGNRL